MSSVRRLRMPAAALAVAVLLAGAPAAVGAGAAGPRPALALASVRIGGPERIGLLRGFDVSEARRGDEVDVVLWPGDLARLESLGLPYRIRTADLVAADRASLSVPPRRTALAEASVRSTYRRLADYDAELRAAAAAQPDLVRVVEGPHRTFQGRTVLGVEIAADVARDDGRPTFFIMGLHHAREWPSGELTMNFVELLVDGYRSDPRITELLQRVRVLAVPVVNPDGFDTSREAMLDGQAYSLFSEAYWRKNRRGVSRPAGVDAGAYGVDPNRNYGYQWGDGTAGASYVPVDETYQGDAPFSEPESRNVRGWIATRNVTTLLTNHTYGNLVLWPWGDTYLPAPDGGMPDDPKAGALTKLGVAMARINGYQPQQSYELYKTTGTTEDWAYATAGTLGFTFELGRTGFHPAYEAVADMWDRNRDAFLLLAEAAGRTDLHGVFTGRVTAPSGAGVAATLRLTKSARLPLNRFAPVVDSELPESVDLSMSTEADGSFEWHLNPSTSPIARDLEDYTLTVTAPGMAPVTRPLFIRRGQRYDAGEIRLRPAG